MRYLIASVSLLACTIIGCANQSPESQLQPRKTVHVCQDGQCSDQATGVQTFKPEPVDAAAQHRLQALEQLAETDPRAAYDLGLRLLRGDGIERNSYQAIQWLRRAGDSGVEAAQLALGQLYLGGHEEMGADPAEAEAWLSRAAAQGNGEAQALLVQAQADKLSSREDYQIRASARKYWGHWYLSAPYYWYWEDRSWYLR